MIEGFRQAHREWLEANGVTEATGERLEILNALQKAASEAIEVIELERSGFRDGDGHWHGSDVVGHVTGDLIELCKRLDKYDRDAWLAKNPELVTGDKTEPW
jgi:hypothetical protein